MTKKFEESNQVHLNEICHNVDFIISFTDSSLDAYIDYKSMNMYRFIQKIHVEVLPCCSNEECMGSISHSQLFCTQCGRSTETKKDPPSFDDIISAFCFSNIGGSDVCEYVFLNQHITFGHPSVSSGGHGVQYKHFHPLLNVTFCNGGDDHPESTQSDLWFMSSATETKSVFVYLVDDPKFNHV